MSIKSVHQSWALLPHRPAILSTDSLQPNLDDAVNVPLRQDLTFCHFVAAAIVLRNVWETHLCYLQEGSCQGILFHSMMYMLLGQGWAIRPPEHCTGSISFLASYDPQSFMLSLAGVFTPILMVRSLLGPLLSFF